MTKLSHRVNGVWTEHSHAPTFMVMEDVPDQDPSVLSVAPGGDALTFRSLLDDLAPPYLLIHILHSPRTGAKAGRYRSPQLTRLGVLSFLEDFELYLQHDGRHDLWAHSLEDESTIVWDSHNLIHAYGPPERFVATLRALGFREGKPSIPNPHRLNRRPVFDKDEEAVLNRFEWVYSPSRRTEKT